MKVLLVAVNAKYIHSNLAVYSLRAYARRHVGRKDVVIEIAEHTINQRRDDILRDIYEHRPDMVCFSCYIWNREYVESIVRDFVKIAPGVPVWLGGPEVSYDAGEALLRLPEVTGIMRGEGEQTFTELCQGKPLEEIPGITFRKKDGTVCENEWREPVDMDELPFVYEDMKEFANKIIYYETSRGCPFSCSYCLSSIDKRLRFRKFSLVKEELRFFLTNNVPQVKFVDRTFNCRHSHATKIWKFLLENDNGVTNFHFEISADLLNEEELALMERMRPGLIQLEIGVQSTNRETVREIKRTMDFEKLSQNVARIRKMQNIHQHLDLIAGLPFEGIERFSQSFDDVYRLKPDQLQLGFLKVLKGSRMEERKRNYGLLHKDDPPYEVLCTNWLSFEEISELKGVEEMVETYYNSRQFEHALGELEKEYASPYRMYRDLFEYHKKSAACGLQHKRNAKYERILEFMRQVCKRGEGICRELLTYDYYLRENAKSRPSFAGENLMDKEKARLFYERESAEHAYLPAYAGYDKSQIRRMTHLEYFPSLGKTVLFDYMERNPLNQEARTVEIK